MARKIVVTSGKGGVGKTSVLASLGICLASKGKNVLMIDGDVGLNNLDVVMGMESRVVYDMADVIDNKCHINQALLQEDGTSLYLLPSAHAYSSERLSAAAFRELIGRIEDTFDFILIDCPAGIDAGFHRAVSCSDEALLVTTPHIPAIRDGDKVLALLRSYKLNAINLIVNRVRGDFVVTGKMMNGGEISNILRCPLVGVVPEDDAITIYSQLGRIGMNSSSSRDAIDMIAENIVNNTFKLYDVTKGHRGLVGKFKRLIGARY
ncbi:MAG: septum site-determining protein MinD [Clostridia bacterium]|nr:septum site-determining protein MinD [Clostridia bacterium]MDE7329213.1 septum site-determining protein MinD [Clostridia bacterium]